MLDFYLIKDEQPKPNYPEKANLEEKIELLNVHLGIGLSRGDRPLQTILKLKKLRMSFLIKQSKTTNTPIFLMPRPVAQPVVYI